MQRMLSAHDRAAAFEQRARVTFETLQDARWRGEPVCLLGYKKAKARWTQGKASRRGWVGVTVRVENVRVYGIFRSRRLM